MDNLFLNRTFKSDYNNKAKLQTSLSTRIIYVLFYSKLSWGTSKALVPVGGSG